MLNNITKVKNPYRNKWYILSIFNLCKKNIYFSIILKTNSNIFYAKIGGIN